MPRSLIVGLILLAVLVAAWFLWLAPTLNRGRAQQAAVKKIKGFQELKATWTGSVQRLRFVAVHSLKLALPESAKVIMKRAWTLSNSRMMFARDGSTPIGWLSGS